MIATVMPFCGTSAARVRLEKRAEELQSEKASLTEVVERKKEEIRERDKTSHARQEELSRLTLRQEANELANQELAKRRESLASLRSRKQYVRTACETYVAEVGMLVERGLEPEVPKLLFEIWDSERFLGEEWLDFAHLGQTSRMRVPLLPRVLFSRGDGKPRFMAAAHREPLTLQFESVRQESRVTLRSVRLLSARPRQSGSVEDEPGARTSERGTGRATEQMPALPPPRLVTLQVWMWGRLTGELDRRVGAGQDARAPELHRVGRLGTVQDLRTPVGAGVGGYEAHDHLGAGTKPVAKGLWRLEVVEVLGVEQEKLAAYPAEDRCMDFELKPGSQPVVVGRFDGPIAAMMEAGRVAHTNVDQSVDTGCCPVLCAPLAKL